jgi:Tfp pilus assembly protein PilF
MRAAGEKAIQLDPLLTEAHEALAMVYARDGQWAQAEKSFRRAIELGPSDSVAYADFTMWFLLPLGRTDEALHQMRIAEKADPVSPRIQDVLGWALLYAGHYEESASHCQKGDRGHGVSGPREIGPGKK